MHVIYHCFGSAHSSVVSAAIHLGRLPDHVTPSVSTIMELEDFDRARTDTIGFLYYKGRDTNGHDVYTIGFGSQSPIVKKAFLDMLKINGEDLNGYCLVESLSSLHYFGIIGGVFSRRYGWVKTGRYLAAKGIQKSYPKLVALVRQTKALLNNR
jgi:hypothetical protein